MSHGGGQPSCTTVSLGKYVRRALRAAAGKPPKRKKPKDPAAAAAERMMIAAAGGVSLERTSSFSADSSSGTARKESVVRVVLKSGVVEVYPGVVLACTVIRNHPPGLCLAHPDVFRNPHGAVVRPLEPLFPGQKFLLLPESTVVRLKQKIPESAVGAFPDDDDDASEEEDQDGYSSGSTTAASSEEEEELDQDAGSAELDDDDDDRGGLMAGCSAREFYVENDRWAQCRFKKLVRSGLAVEQSTDGHPNGKGHQHQQRHKTKKRKGKKTTNKKRNDRHVRFATPMGFRTLTTLRRMWEPTLPSVEEGGEASSATTPEIVVSSK